MGTCILEAEQPGAWPRTRLADAIEHFDQTRRGHRTDRAHKMVLLFEFVCRATPVPTPVAVRAGQL